MDVVTSMAFALIVVVPLWRIFERAGLQPAIALVVLIPSVGVVIAAAILAFAQWGPPVRDPHQPDLFDHNRSGGRR